MKFAEQQCSRLVETNFDLVFKIFKKHYQLVPLEVFSDDPYKTLISTILSARTKDEVTLKRSLVLFEKAPNLKSLSSLSQAQIEKIIYPVGFYKNKARYLYLLGQLKLTTIPNSQKKLIQLPGVGRKTANLTLNRAFAKPYIAVDIHVHRITNLLGWVKTTSPYQTEEELIKILPKRYWSEINKLFVSVGRQFNTRKKLLGFLKSHSLLSPDHQVPN